MNVPVHATLLSIISLLLIIFGSQIAYRNQKIPWITISLGNIWCGLVIPFIIWKVIKTKKQNPVIPNVLQMHDENEDSQTLQGDQVRNKDFENNASIADVCIDVRGQLINQEKSGNLEQCKENSEVLIEPRKLISDEMRNDNFEEVSNTVDENDDCIQLRSQSVIFYVNPRKKVRDFPNPNTY